MIVSLFKSLHKSKDVPFYLPLEKVIDRIRTGKSLNVLRNVYSSKTDEERNAFKKELPCILFAGQFSERNDDALIEHSGLMVLDYDNIPKEEVKTVKDNLRNNPFIVSYFDSPSLTGVKAIVRISKANKELHKRLFKGFENKYKHEYFDPSSCNISRVCFESYDPEIYYNPDAQIFNEPIDEEGYFMTEKVPLAPIENESIIIERLMKWWDSKYGFIEGKRNDNIFLLSGAFSDYGVAKDTAIGYIWNNIVHGSFTEQETKTTVNSAYRKFASNFGSKYFEDNEKIKNIKNDLKTNKTNVVAKKFNIDKNVIEQLLSQEEHENFWNIEKNKVIVNSLKFKFFLQRHGFKKHYPEGASKPNFVFIQSMQVVDCNKSEIKDFVLNYLAEKGEIDVWNFCAGSKLFFSDEYLTFLDTVDLLMLRDTKDKSFIAYQNGILEVTKDAIILKDYIDVGCYIWKKQIINRNFELTNKFENDYKTFINRVSSGLPTPIESVLGYLLCTYKNRMNNKAIILNDEIITPNPEGGTGKGVFMQGISQIRKVAIIDGKEHDDKKSFPYQTVSQDCQIIFFDDVIKNFSFEKKFSLVTEGITLERKNKDAIKLSVEESPKMAISTNYAIKGEGNSHDRRRFEIEFSQYFGKDRTPEDEFKRELFKDWTNTDYIAFDNYMVRCLQSYLDKGLIKQDAKNIELRKFLASTSDEFFEWVEDAELVPRNTNITKSEAYTAFQSEYKDYNWLKAKTFHIWLDKYCKYKNYKLVEGNGNGRRWFMIQDGLALKIEEAPF